MQAAEIRRRQEEEQKLQRLYQLHEERRMQEELSKKRIEQEVGLTLRVYLWTLYHYDVHVMGGEVSTKWRKYMNYSMMCSKQACSYQLGRYVFSHSTKYYIC